MSISFRSRQVIAVTALVVGCMTALTTLHLGSIVTMSLQESQARGQLMARSIFHQARGVVAASTDVVPALGADAGVRAILESSIAYTSDVIYAAIVDPTGRTVVHSSPTLVGTRPPPGLNLNELLRRGRLGQLRGVYDHAILDIDQPLLLGDEAFGSVRVGLSTVLIRDELQQAVRPAATTLVATLGVALLVSIALAQRIVQPIHVIRAGLTRLGHGEADVALDLPRGDEFSALERSFETVRARLDPDTRSSRIESSPKVASLARLLGGIAHEVKNPLHAMTIHLELLQQKLGTDSAHESLATDRPVGSVFGLKTMGRRHAGRSGAETPVATCPAETDDAGPSASVTRHVTVIAREIQRLDEVIQGFLSFIRPETFARDLVALPDLVDEVLALVEPEAARSAIHLENRCPSTLPLITGDRAKLREALLNLALNACHAMPSGGGVRVSGGTSGTTHVWLDMEDTGTGMPPEVLERVFDLFYTTKGGGSGIGLAMVYRTVLLHDGTIEIESTPGSGTRLRITMPCA